MMDILSGVAFIAILLLVIYFRTKRDFWYDLETDVWFPKCHICKGKRDKYCPKSCLGDES